MSNIQNCKVASAVLASRIDQTVSENNYRQFAYDCARQAAAITRSELEAVLRECRRAFDYYDCSIEQWSVAEERKLRKEAIAKIDEVLHVKE